jgi:hypothetical protein
VAHPTKKPWIKPEVKRFESLLELSKFYLSKASATDRQKLEEFVNQAQIDQKRPKRERKLRRNSNG